MANEKQKLRRVRVLGVRILDKPTIIFGEYTNMTKEEAVKKFFDNLDNLDVRDVEVEE